MYSNEKSTYLDRVIQANRDAFREAMIMSEAVKELILETAKEQGWLADREDRRAIEIAKRLIRLGDSVEKVVDATKLPYEIVIGLK